jgi:hypothetical protein
MDDIENMRSITRRAYLGAYIIGPYGINSSEKTHKQFFRTKQTKVYSAMILLAHSTKDTKMAGLPNLAHQWLRSASVIALARPQAPHAKIAMRLGCNLLESLD